MTRIFLAVAAILLFAYACSSDQTAEQSSSDSAAACKPKPLNPNGDSELAVLMREMANWTDSCKAAIVSGRPVPPKPEKLGTLHTAKRTDETIDASLYNSMASLYQGMVLQFEQSPESGRKDAYNSMVSACAGCHQNFCQGPLVRINKMFLE
jgi:hypothetical protein